MEALADQSALLERQRRGVDQAAQQPLGQRGQRMQAPGGVLEQARAGRRQRAGELRHRLQRGGQGAQVASVALSRADARDEPLEVAHVGQRLAQGVQQGSLGAEVLNGVVAPRDGLDRAGRP